tara:strand:- start:1219 stop:1455 length:237 start_codon:yes stop_codon:yes gene_type:complete
LKIKSLASRECANYFDGKCLVQNKKCWVSEKRCGYFESSVLPGINRHDHPDYLKYKNAIQKYRDTIQYSTEDNDSIVE